MSKKFKGNDRGITILHALVSIMLLTVISSILYSSAMENLQSHQYQKEYQQTYLTVSSAADVFLDSFRDDIIVHEVVTPIGEDGTIMVNNWDYLDYNLANPVSSNAIAWFKQVYLDSVSKNEAAFLEYYNNNPLKKDFYIKATDKLNASNSLDTVKATVIIKGWNAYVNFSLDGIVPAYNYYMCATIPLTGYKSPYSTNDRNGTVNYNGNEYTETIRYVYHIQFDTENMIISKGSY